MNLTDLKNEMLNVPIAEPIFLYIGVGTAAGDKHYLHLDNYQQFPPFLQDMRNQVPNLHLFLLLIDPQQESPPYVATDYALEDRYKSDCHYRSVNGLLQTFVYRLTVYTDADVYPPANGLNITPLLRDLNAFAKEKQISLLYHDFTGRKMSLLAEHFDNENADHLDHLIYGMSAREDHGCFFDLTQPTAYFPYKIEKQANKRPVIKMFNYYAYIKKDNYAESVVDLESYPLTMHTIAVKQREQIIRVIQINFKTIYLSLLRQVHKLLLEEGPSTAASEAASEAASAAASAAASEAASEAQSAAVEANGNYLFNNLPKLFREMFTALYKEKEYSLLYELLFNYSASELDMLAKLKGMDLSGEDLLTFITLDKDPYKWHNTANELL